MIGLSLGQPSVRAERFSDSGQPVEVLFAESPNLGLVIQVDDAERFVAVAENRGAEDGTQSGVFHTVRRLRRGGFAPHQTLLGTAATKDGLYGT